LLLSRRLTAADWGLELRGGSHTELKIPHFKNRLRMKVWTSGTSNKNTQVQIKTNVVTNKIGEILFAIFV